MPLVPNQSIAEDATDVSCRGSVGCSIEGISQMHSDVQGLQASSAHASINGHSSVEEFGHSISENALQQLANERQLDKRASDDFAFSTQAASISENAPHLSELSRTSELAAPALPESIRKKRVLVMDDEEPIRLLVEAMLEMFGYEVVTVSNGGDAVAAHADALESGNAFDIVIMDLMIPSGMGGKDAIQQIRQKDTALKAIVSSGHSSDPVVVRHAEFGFNAVLKKPYLLKDIRHVLDQVSLS